MTGTGFKMATRTNAAYTPIRTNPRPQGSPATVTALGVIESIIRVGITVSLPIASYVDNYTAAVNSYVRTRVDKWVAPVDPLNNPNSYDPLVEVFKSNVRNTSL